MNLILFGLKGCGKTFWGKRLAEKRGMQFLDTDTLLGDPRALYQRVGEEAFRALEKKAILSLKDVQNTVIALGGGALVDPENVSFLQTIGRLVYLKASRETLQKRIFETGVPAFLDPNDPIGSFLTYFQVRSSLYAEIAAEVIDVDYLEEIDGF